MSSKNKTVETKNTAPSSIKISVIIDNMNYQKNSNVKAYASANIGGAFAIHGIRVIDSDKGMFISMPTRSYEKDGTTKYSEIFHPISATARSQLNAAVLNAYEQRLHMSEDVMPVEEVAPKQEPSL